jgi:hypothetical protein
MVLPLKKMIIYGFNTENMELKTLIVHVFTSENMDSSWFYL